MPKVSIIVPVYNTEKYVDRCIQSIIGQTFKDFELILVNDGSTDASGRICEDWAKADKRITAIHQPNKGVSAARNKGTSIAQGEYVCFVDSDDTVKSCWLDIIIKANEGKDADIITYGFAQYSAGSLTYINSADNFYAKSKEELSPYFYNFIAEKLGSSCDKLFKKNLLEANSVSFDENVKINEDALFNYKALPCANSFLNISEALYVYEHHEGSASQKGHADLLDTIVDRVPKYRKFIADMGFGIDESKVESIISEGVFLQYLQAVISNNDLAYKTRIQILNRLYSNKAYRQILIKKLKEQPKSFAFLLGRLSARLKLPFVVALPSQIKKLSNGK